MILIVTDPVTRLHSEYVHNKLHSKGPEDLHFPEGVHTFEELIFTNGTRTVNEKYRPVRTGLYYMGMEAFLKYFKRNQMLILDGGKFKRDPLYGLKQAEQFLEIPSYFNANHFLFNATKGFWCLHSSGCMGVNKGRAHPELSQATRTALFKYYHGPNKKFRDLTALDFDWLNQKGSYHDKL